MAFISNASFAGTLQGVGVFEFCWRGLRYANLKSRLKKMKKDFKANEDIWRRQGDMKKLIEVSLCNSASSTVFSCPATV